MNGLLTRSTHLLCPSIKKVDHSLVMDIEQVEQQTLENNMALACLK